MSGPMDDFVAWVQETLPQEDYVYSRGMWVDNADLATRRIVSVISEGGPKPGVISRFSRVRLLILGPQNGRAAAPELESLGGILIERAMDEVRAGCLTQIRPMSDIIGPGYTTEIRPWYELNFELTI